MLRRTVVGGRTYAQWLLRDLENLARFGLQAPRSGELIWIRPDECVRAVRALVPRTESGRVLDGDWDRDTRPLNDFWKISCARDHWENGVPWSKTGAYEHLAEAIEQSGRRLDGCKSRKDIRRRYQDLDGVFEQVKEEGRLRTQSELSESKLRKRNFGGVYVHIARDSEPLFGQGGFHRLAMAQVLGLKEIPAQVGLVHAAAIKEWRQRFARTPDLGGHEAG